MTASSNLVVRLEEDIETLKELVQGRDIDMIMIDGIVNRLVGVKTRLDYLERHQHRFIDGSIAGEKHREESSGAGT